MTSQEHFEAWHRSVVIGEPPHEKYTDGSYRNQHVQRYWLGWQASRAALVIELPDDGIEDCRKAWGSGCVDSFDCGYNFACQQHEKAIEAAGVKVSP